MCASWSISKYALLAKREVAGEVKMAGRFFLRIWLRYICKLEINKNAKKNKVN